MSDKNSKYYTLDKYNESYLSRVENKKDSNIKENYGSFSISAAVRYPYSPSRMDPSYKQPKLTGVN